MPKKVLSAVTMVVVCFVASPVLVGSTDAGGNERPFASFIVKGDDVKEGEFPFLVAITGDGAYRCAGAIISSNAVITVCHCLLESTRPHVLMDAKVMRIHAGVVNILSYDVKKLVPYPSCSALPQFYLDMGMIQIRGKFQPQPNLIEIKQLPQFNGNKLIKNFTDKNTTCLTMGWGEDKTEENPVILRKLEVILQDTATCEQLCRKWPSERNRTHLFIDSLEICALSVKPGSTTCYGDSGAPLVCGDKLELVAVTRGSPGVDPCGKENVPLLYSRLDNTEEWIKSQIDNFTEDASNDPDTDTYTPSSHNIPSSHNTPSSHSTLDSTPIQPIEIITVRPPSTDDDNRMDSSESTMTSTSTQTTPTATSATSKRASSIYDSISLVACSALKYLIFEY